MYLRTGGNEMSFCVITKCTPLPLTATTTTATATLWLHWRCFILFGFPRTKFTTRPDGDHVASPCARSRQFSHTYVCSHLHRAARFNFLSVYCTKTIYFVSWHRFVSCTNEYNLSFVISNCYFSLLKHQSYNCTNLPDIFVIRLVNFESCIDRTLPSANNRTKSSAQRFVRVIYI